MTTEARDDDLDAIVERLDDILRELWPGHPGHRLPADESLRTLGVESSVLISFLVAVEDRCGLSWGEDLPAGALSSLGSMAQLVRESAHA